MILVLPFRRNSILFFSHVCLVHGEIHILVEDYLKWEWEAGGRILKMRSGSWHYMGADLVFAPSVGCPFPRKNDHCPLPARSMGDIVQGLVFV